MLIRLKRFSYSDTETEGVLHVGDRQFATIEKPWVPNPNGARGGKPFESCIPDGLYALSPWVRPSGERCWIISQASNGVYKHPSDLPGPDSGRYLCLIHAGNFAADVVGCVAPGLTRRPISNRFAVRDSNAAMRELFRLLGTNRHVLSIEPAYGASDDGQV